MTKLQILLRLETLVTLHRNVGHMVFKQDRAMAYNNCKEFLETWMPITVDKGTPEMMKEANFHYKELLRVQ